MKIVHASPGFGRMMDAREAEEFLAGSRLNLLLGTLDARGEPNVHPVWYVYERGRLYVETATSSAKAANARRSRRVYFCIDDEREPYRGVRGKGDAIVHDDARAMIGTAERIMTKYTGGTDNRIASELLGAVRAGSSAIIEIEPVYLATWDHGA